MYTLARAKNDYALDFIHHWRILRTDSHEWMIEIRQEIHEPTISRLLCDTRTKKARKFKTLDAAIKVVQDIGFAVDGLENLRKEGQAWT